MKTAPHATITDESGQQILIVDDTPANLDLLTSLLEPRGYRVLAAPGGEVALRVAVRARPDLVLLDVMMPGMDGYETCRRLKDDSSSRDIPVLFISARDEVQSLVEGFHAGAVDYITKPFNTDEVLARVQTHLEISRLTRELRHRNMELEDALASVRRERDKRELAETALHEAGERLSVISDREAARWGLSGFVGHSSTLTRIVHDIRRLQNFSSVNALITGESGTGKELVARAIHFGSPSAKGPFIPVNCVAIPEDLAESTLFGHVRGAFTGATSDRKGYFEMAHGGTLFLDEVGDMPASLQAKLLRVLEDGQIMPVGGTKEKKVDVRIVAATNADLQRQIATGSFRRDLYFRLAQFTVDVPPLRDRREDIPLLAQHFLKLFAAEMGMQPPALTPAAMAMLTRHDYPGNIRELKNLIERALIESGGETIEPPHLRITGTEAVMDLPATGRESKPSSKATGVASAEGLPLNLEEAEDLLIRRALAETGGNIAEAARRLGINRTRIYRKLNAQG